MSSLFPSWKRHLSGVVWAPKGYEELCCLPPAGLSVWQPADLLGFSWHHNQLRGLQRMVQNVKNIQWAALEECEEKKNYIVNLSDLSEGNRKAENSFSDSQHVHPSSGIMGQWVCNGPSIYLGNVPHCCSQLSEKRYLCFFPSAYLRKGQKERLNDITPLFEYLFIHSINTMMNNFLIVFQHQQALFWFDSMHIWCSRKLATCCKNSLLIQSLKSLSIKDKPLCNLVPLHHDYSTLCSLNCGKLFTVKTPRHSQHGIG